MAGSTSLAPLQRVPGRRAVRAALIWLISLASYSPADPVWFFNTGSELPPANFAGRVGAFLAELSYQLLGYAAYLAPVDRRRHRLALFLVPHARRGLHEAFGAALLFGCIASFLSLAFGALDVAGKEFRAGGYIGAALSSVLCRVPEPHRLDHPDPDAALPGDHPVDAVLVRPAVRRARARWPRPLGGAARRRSRRGATRSSARSSARKC